MRVLIRLSTAFLADSIISACQSTGTADASGPSAAANFAPDRTVTMIDNRMQTKYAVGVLVRLRF